MDDSDINILFDYWDWCRERGLSQEQTKQDEYIAEYGFMMRRRGVKLNGLHVLMMRERWDLIWRLM